MILNQASDVDSANGRKRQVMLNREKDVLWQVEQVSKGASRELSGAKEQFQGALKEMTTAVPAQ